MQLVLLLAGAGSRLRPLTLARPKTLIRLAGKPILGHLLERILRSAPVDELIVVCSPAHKRNVREYLRSAYALKVALVEQKTPRGQAHAVFLARQHLRGPFLLAFGDTIVETTLSVMDTCDADGLIFVKQVEDARSHGAVMTRGNTVVEFVEKPAIPVSGRVAAGLYFVKNVSLFLESLNATVARAPRGCDEIFLADVWQTMMRRGAVLQAVDVEHWEDCGEPLNLFRAHHYLLRSMIDQGWASAGVLIKPPIYIAPSAVVERSSIGPHVSIEEGCVVRGSTLADCLIGEGSTIEDSHLRNSLVGHKSYVYIPKGLSTIMLGDYSQISFDPMHSPATGLGSVTASPREHQFGWHQ